MDTAPAHVASMQAIAGDPAFTANVVDWIRGYDGTLTNTPRFYQDPSDPCNTKGWLLGPIINSTPAVVGGPYQYKQFGNVADHRPFEATYASRRPLAWVGSDDGMLHAFDFNDGTEVLALIPPNLLETQIALYKNYVAGKPTDDNITGQVKTIDQHIWGVANSFRFADVWFGTGYKTVGFLTEGPGGDLHRRHRHHARLPRVPDGDARRAERPELRRDEARRDPVDEELVRLHRASSGRGASRRSPPIPSPRAGCSSAPASIPRASSRRPSTRRRSSWTRRTGR